jgi:hypothetical protein
MKKPKSRTLDLPSFPNEFWESILNIRNEEPKRFNLFSPGFKRSAEVYEDQRDRTHCPDKGSLIQPTPCQADYQKGGRRARTGTR